MNTNSSIINFDNLKDDATIRRRATDSAIEGGPNSGFELDDMSLFKDDAAAGEFPEMKDDFDLIITTEAYVNRLIDFDYRMRAAKGISRGMALELKELLPDLQSFNPLHYTQDTSGVKYEVSMEAISAQIWAMIVAAVAVGIAIIYKFISWLSGGSSGGGGGGGGGSSTTDAVEGLKEAEKNVGVQVKSAEKVSKIATKLKGKKVKVAVPVTQSHADVTHSHMPPDVKEKIIRDTKDSAGKVDANQSQTVDIEVEILAGMNKIAADHKKDAMRISSESYIRLVFSEDTTGLDVIREAFDLFGDAADSLLAKIASLSDMIDSAGTDGSNHQAFANISLPEPTRIESTYYSSANLSILQHWPILLNAELNKHKGNDPPDDFGETLAMFYRGYDRLGNSPWPKLLKLFPVLKEGEESLNKMKAFGDKYSKKVGSSDPNAQTNALTLRAATRSVMSEMNSLMMIYSTLAKIYSDMSMGGFDMLSSFNRHLKRIATFITKYGQEIPPDLIEVQEDIQKHIDIWRKNPVNRRFMNDNAWSRHQRGLASM